MIDETELMRRVATGEGQGIRMLLDEHYEPIFRLLRHLSGNREDAEDLTQEVFLTARTKGASFAGLGSIRTWLTRIAVNSYAKHLRRERLRRICRFSDPKPRGAVEAMIDSEWLLSGISQLSPTHRLALLLHDVHGFSVREVAAITKSPEGTVKARLHYARKKVQQVLICPDEEIG